jgi:hypothetical protein
MFKRLAVLSLAAIAVTTTVHAQNKPALTCKDLAIPLHGLPTDTPLSISLTPAQLVAQCTSSTGDQLTLVSPQGGISLAPAAGEARTATFTVQDTHGNSVSARVTVSRN